MSTHAPATRDEFKAKVLRQLGAPVIEINVADDQVEDCVEEALKYFQDYHYDGSEHSYYHYKLTADDIENKYITIPNNIIGITKIYSLQTQAYSLYNADMWSGGYQMAFDFAYNFASGSITTYYMNQMSYEFLNQILVGQVPLRFNRHVDKLYIDYDWKQFNVDDYIMLDCYTAVDSTQVWNDRWLLRYCAAKVKLIWGSNLSKFEGVQLPGGVTMNGTKIYDDAAQEVEKLEQEMISNYSIPPRDVVA